MGKIEAAGKTDPAPFPPEYYSVLLAGLIHKLNNVVTVIFGHSGLLMLEKDLDEKIRRPLEQMSGAAVSISRFLDHSAMVAKAVPLQIENVVVNELLAALKTPAGLTVRRHCDPTLRVIGDRPKLINMLSHLLLNAAEAQASTVNIIAEVSGSSVIFRFRDNGAGVQPDVISRIFDPFFTTSKDNHVGLGLFQVRGNLARMSGSITAESDGESYTEILVTLQKTPDA